MSVMNRKMFNRGARDELRRRGGIMASSEPMMQAVGYENGGRISDELMQYLASLRPRLQGGAVPGGSFPTNTVYDPDPAPQIPVSPTYDMTQFGSLDLPKVTGGYQGVPVVNFLDRSGEKPNLGAPDVLYPTPLVSVSGRPGDGISGREQFEIDYREENSNPEVELQMKVLEKARGGEQVKNAALDLGETLLDMLNLGGGAVVLGANEVAALGLDTLGILTGGGDVSKSILRFAENVRQKGLVNRNDLFDADGNLTLNTRLVGEGPYEGQLEKAKERLQETLKRQGILSDEEKDQIRRESLANIADAQDKQILSGVNTGVFADTGDSIPAFSTRDRLGQGLTRVDGTEIAPKADELNPAILVGDSTFPVGEQGTMQLADADPKYTILGGVVPPDRLVNPPPDPTLFGRGPSLNPLEQGVVSALPGVVNEPPADVPQTTKQKISEALVDLGAGGIERIGGTIDEGIEFLKSFISGDDTTPASPNPMSLGERKDEADPSVVEELTATADQLKNKFTKKAGDLVDAVKKKLENLSDAEEIPNIEKASTLENNKPLTGEEDSIIENNKPLTEVQLDDKTADEPILSDDAANELFGGDTNLTTTITNLTKGDVGNMKDDLYNVTDDESFESYVSKYVKQYQELFKEDEDQIAKDKGFALAIFGSVYGSTGDWAQASAAMIDMLRGDKATRQARNDKVKMLAINTAADRKAADLKYKRALNVASVRASGTNKYTEERERSRLREEIIKNPSEHAASIYKDGKIDPKLLNKYVDDIIKAQRQTGDQGSDIPSDVLSEYQKFIKENPTLKDKALKRLEEKGYNTKGLE